ncbi:transglycosylase SLT domain-containing protein [Paracoccus sp. p4-l81]|uniref:transglycosylase SLT domain-containing protein n=1 Tax=unclassified Paracoccus (in: a-proteobacteria) TaxID=2688777 RepID=UPI0035B8C672
MRALALLLIAALPLTACGGSNARVEQAELFEQGPAHPGPNAELNRLIAHYARVYDVPVSLVHRVVKRESNYNPGARNGPYYGLMQILPQTAQTMGHRGSAEALLDADTNLRYAVKYLRGAWMCADGSESRAVMWYAKGYYYEAKRRGILKEVGLRS